LLKISRIKESIRGNAEEQTTRKCDSKRDHKTLHPSLETIRRSDASEELKVELCASCLPHTLEREIKYRDSENVTLVKEKEK